MFGDLGLFSGTDSKEDENATYNKLNFDKNNKPKITTQPIRVFNALITVNVLHQGKLKGKHEYIPFKWADRYGLIDEATFYVYKTNQYSTEPKFMVSLSDIVQIKSGNETGMFEIEYADPKSKNTTLTESFEAPNDKLKWEWMELLKLQKKNFEHKTTINNLTAKVNEKIKKKLLITKSNEGLSHIRTLKHNIQTKNLNQVFNTLFYVIKAYREDDINRIDIYDFLKAKEEFPHINKSMHTHLLYLLEDINDYLYGDEEEETLSVTSDILKTEPPSNNYKPNNKKRNKKVHHDRGSIEPNSQLKIIDNYSPPRQNKKIINSNNNNKNSNKNFNSILNDNNDMENRSEDLIDDVINNMNLDEEQVKNGEKSEVEDDYNINENPNDSGSSYEDENININNNNQQNDNIDPDEDSEENNVKYIDLSLLDGPKSDDDTRNPDKEVILQPGDY